LSKKSGRGHNAANAISMLKFCEIHKRRVREGAAADSPNVVIPGRDAVASPETITTVENMDSGPTPYGVSRKDDTKIGAKDG
jgi:hypothetical protein